MLLSTGLFHFFFLAENPIPILEKRFPHLAEPVKGCRLQDAGDAAVLGLRRMALGRLTAVGPHSSLSRGKPMRLGAGASHVFTGSLAMVCAWEGIWSRRARPLFAHAIARADPSLLRRVAPFGHWLKRIHPFTYHEEYQVQPDRKTAGAPCRSSDCARPNSMCRAPRSRKNSTSFTSWVKRVKVARITMR